MILSLLLPICLLGTLAILVPRMLERVMPESLTGIVLTAILSAALLWVISSAGFGILYALEDARVLALVANTPSAGVGHFLRLGANAALIWGPVLLLVVTTSPRRWKSAIW